MFSLVILQFLIFTSENYTKTIISYTYDAFDIAELAVAGRVSHMNLVNGPAHHETLVAQLVRAPNRYLGGHGFDSGRGRRFFLCPTFPL